MQGRQAGLCTPSHTRSQPASEAAGTGPGITVRVTVTVQATVRRRSAAGAAGPAAADSDAMKKFRDIRDSEVGRGCRHLEPWVIAI